MPDITCNFIGRRRMCLRFGWHGSSSHKSPLHSIHSKSRRLTGSKYNTYRGFLSFKKSRATGVPVSIEPKLLTLMCPWFDWFEDDWIWRDPLKTGLSDYISCFRRRIDWRGWSSEKMSTTSGAILQLFLWTTQGNHGISGNQSTPSKTGLIDSSLFVLEKRLVRTENVDRSATWG